jgi:pimeloyl-ACP methyl ester carboxylesterase/DNA-binding CsgD family transcriptional regulator
MRATFRGKHEVPRGAQYATTEDGVRIAYVTAGAGHALFWCPHFLASHVELEWEFPQRYIYAFLSKRCQVVRFDGRGLGLSDRDVDDVSLDARMRDLTAVAARLGLDRFALAGVQGGGNLAAAYAATYPERVTHLVLLNWAPNFRDEAAKERMQAMAIMLQRDWDMLTENIGGVSFGYNSPFAAGYGRLVRASATQDMALRYGRQILEEDCYALLSQVECETLVLHSEKSSYASSESARSAAAAIPHGRLREFEGDLPDHIERVVAAVADFVAPLPEGRMPAPAPAPTPAPARPTVPGTLTTRELEVLHLLVRGLSNREMAGELVLSPRTIERHLENLYRKTGTRNRAEAAAYAVGQGLLRSED